mmetsp:Transcript_11820/g.16430  ORF Transcript_11820/g.16430 Transcript_11820/m.16430 type:complete len:410 (+) Transcript_11820:397-1626(+)
MGKMRGSSQQNIIINKLDDHLLLGDGLIHFTQLEGSEGLEETSTVVGARGVGHLQHLLGKLAIELRPSLAQVALHVHKLLKVVELTIHLDNGNLVVEEGVRAVGELDTRVRASQFPAARGPADGGALVEQVSRLEVGVALLLDHSHAKDLAVGGVRDKLSGKHLDDDVGLGSLRGDEGLEIGLPGLDGGLDRLKGVTALFHITLDLPGELDLIGDVEVNSEIKQLSHTIIKHGVEALNNHDRGGLDLLGGVQGTVDVVVDGLLDGLAGLELLQLFVHEVEVVLLLVKSGQTRNLTAVSVVQMVVIEADNCCGRRHKGVGLPATIAEATTKHLHTISAEHASKTAHEGGLTAARIGSYTNENHLLPFLQSHLKSRRRAGGFQLGTIEGGGEGHHRWQQGQEGCELVHHFG